MKNQNQIKENLLKQSLILCQRAFAYNFIFSFFINIFTLATSIYSLQVLDRVLSSSNLNTLLMLSIIMIVIYVILGFLQAIRSFIFTQISNWLDSKLSSIVLESSITYESKNKGSQNLRDLTTLRSFITGQAITHLFDAPWCIIYFIVIFIIHWTNGFIVLGGAIILLILALLNEKLTKKNIEKINEINVLSMQQVDAISRNSEVIQAMGMKENITKSWQEINKEYNKISTITQSKSAVISSVTKSIRLLIQMLTMAVGAVLVIKGKMSAGGIIAVSILSGKALAPFDAAVTIYKSLIDSNKSYQRLVEVLKNYEAKEQKIKLPQPHGKLDIENLIYKLPNSDHLIIKAINAKINAGEAIGIIGPSGSGKTTLARLIVGILQPTKGTIRIDDADIKNQDSEDIGQYLGYLPQDVELFNVTVKENIARMHKKAKSEAIIAAAKFANVHELILRFPLGYETNANSLSAGQRQRVALARAFYQTPKIVVLDEPNSNLDNEGEVALVKAIQNAKKHKITTITISHRPSILKSVDRILVMHAGEIKMFDSAEKVIKALAGGNK